MKDLCEKQYLIIIQILETNEQMRFAIIRKSLDCCLIECVGAWIRFQH